MIKYNGSTIINDVALCIDQLANTGKMMFGFDYPMFSPYTTYKLLREIVKKKHLKQKQIEGIMCQNMIRIMERKN